MTATSSLAGRVAPSLRTSSKTRGLGLVEVGLDELHLHDLRHLAGTLAASTGAGTKELMYRLGHASPQAALRYQHATRQRDVAIASALDTIIRKRTKRTL